MKHRIISLILVLVLAVGLNVPSAWAAEGDWRYARTVNGLRLTGYLGNETELTLPDTLAGQPVVEIGPGCFRDSSLTEVTIPHGIRVIGDEAFSGSTGLKKVHLGGSVNVIGRQAFAHTGLIKMDIPGCVRSIGAEAFLGCTALYNIVIEEGVEEWALDVGDSLGSGSVKIGEGVESIGDRAFYGCTNLTRMRLPKSVEVIGTHAIGYTDAGRQSGYQITGYAGSTAERYAAGNSLEFVALESDNGTSGICGENVNWSWDRGTGTLTLSGSGRMYDYASADCLPWYGFRDAINTVRVGEGITSLSEYAFSGSTATQITLPASLGWVGTGAFADCGSLRELTFSGNAPVFGSNAFENTTLTAWYPNYDDTWTREVRQNYGGSVTWLCSGGLPFVDVPEKSFYYDPVAWALEKGITNGTDATHFSPDRECQRAQVVTFLWRAAGSPEPKEDKNPFVDVEQERFYHKAVLWAVEEGITNGLDADHFGPYEYCNRAQVVTFLYRAGGCPAVIDPVNPFVDVPAGSFYFEPVLWAVKEEITNGMDAMHFGPDDICNRAQIVTFLYRAMADGAQ